jgi:hypothetical protein
VPIFAAIFYFALVKDHYYSYDMLYWVLVQVLVFTLFIPLLLFYLLVHYKKIDTIMAAKVSERKIPLVANCLLLLALILKVTTKENLPELYYFYAGSIMSSLIALLLVFFKQKASLHMVAIAGLTAFVLGLLLHFQIKSTLLVALLLFCNGLVATSRLTLKAHTHDELTIGFFIGLLPQLFLLNYWL